MSMSAALRPRKHARHAKPSKAAPVLAAGGLTLALGVADAAALGGVASAASSDANWDRLAACESGQRWNINSGNGYFGGLQFNLATWRGVGMGGYPHEASRETQIAAANRLHDARGFAPWPACSRKLGLTGGGGGGGVAAAKAAPAPHTHAAPAAAPAAAPTAARRAAPASRSRVTTAPGVFSGRTMTVADRGTFRTDVRDWQRQLRARGWKITVDGFYGPQSASVAQRFGREKGLRAARGTVDAAAFAAAWTARVT